MKVSKHAQQRIKERCGLHKKSYERMAKKAWEEGVTHAETKGNLNKWVTKLFFVNTNANNIRLYGDKAYIFCGETLVTVMQIPSNLMKDFKKMVKEKGTKESGEFDELDN